MATWGGVAGEDASGPRPGIGLGHPGGVGQWRQGPQSKADGRRPAVLTGGVLLPSAPSEVPAAVEATRAPREGGILQILGASGAAVRSWELAGLKALVGPVWSQRAEQSTLV